jgi:hypothetical protein
MKRNMSFRGLRSDWSRLALALVVVALIVATQGCCCCSTKCVDQIGTIIQNECRKASESTVTAGVFVFDEKPSAADPGCIAVKPTKIKAGAGENIQFVNLSAATLTLKSSVSGFFSTDDAIDLAPGQTKVVGIRKDLSLAKGAIIGINLEVEPPGEKCSSEYPGPSIEWD